MKLITLAHGSGGEDSRRLINDVFIKEFNDPLLNELEDASVVCGPGKIAVTTDGFTVSPLFFKGGDIGKLSVAGTVNDLAVMGAKPLFMTVSFIIEEGLPFEDLKRIVGSMSREAKDVGIRIIAGDTKVVPKGHADKVFISAAGIGEIVYEGLSSRNLAPGDVILVSGTVGDHGACIMAEREGMNFEMDLESDCSPLWDLIESLLARIQGIKAMRDPTRGGIAAVLNEWAQASGVEIEVDEASIPVKDPVKGICELLGFEPTHLANEGMVVIAVEEKFADEALNVLKNHPKGKDAAIIGRVASRDKPRVVIRTLYGALRIMENPSGELLPRIC